MHIYQDNALIKMQGSQFLGEKNEVDSLARRMRSEWDDRISHDYRYWMSDGIKDDSAMWSTGERDLEILLRGSRSDELQNQIALELGCGVGRILKAASKRFKRVIGVDVSHDLKEALVRYSWT